MRVVFVHPSHPSQFTRIAYGLRERLGWECSFLVSAAFTEQIRAESPPIAFYGLPEEPEGTSCYYTQALESGARRGKAVLDCLDYLEGKLRFDVVVGHASFGTTFYLGSLLSLPVVSYVELPGHLGVYARPEFPARREQAIMDLSLRSLILTSVLHSDLCIAPSEYARGLLPPELQPRVRVQMEGFRLPTGPTDRAALRRRLELPPEAPIVGFAARSLEAVRGFDVFVKVAKAVSARRPDARFLVLGDDQTLYGNETAYLGGTSFREHVLRSEGVDEGSFIFRRFMPHDRFVRHLQSMDAILFPIFEGAANWGLFEAMAAELPVLASNRCFVPEAIVNGRDGLLFEPADVAGFAAATLEILERPERFRRLGRNARRRIARQFSERAAEDGYAAILREAVEKGAAGAKGRRIAVA